MTESRTDNNEQEDQEERVLSAELGRVKEKMKPKLDFPNTESIRRGSRGEILPFHSLLIIGTESGI